MHKQVYCIIVTYNAVPWLEKCFGSLRSSTYPLKTIVIDNGSTDGTQQRIQDEYPEVDFIQSNENLGFGRANNIGISKAIKNGADFVFLLNQDAAIAGDMLEKLVSVSLLNPEFGIISPLQLHNEDIVDANHLKTLLDSKCLVFNDMLAGNELKDIYEIYYTNAALWLVTNDCLRKVGGFDPLFPHYGEDNDYATRVKHFGFKIGLCPSAKGFHFRNQVSKSNISAIGYRNKLYLRFLLNLKKPGNSLTGAYFSMIAEISKAAVKHLLQLDFSKAKSHISVGISLFANRGAIIRSRKNNTPYFHIA